MRLSVSPNPVDEGQSVTVTATLSRALPGSVTVPLVLTRGTAESGDFGSLASITISGGGLTGTGTVTTTDDADEDDETFTVALGSLPAEVMPGTPSSVEVTIRDSDGTTPVNHSPVVSVSCDPRVVARGGEVRLTATASDPDGDPLTYRWSATTGRFEGPTDQATARWTAPDEAGRVTVHVEVADERGGSAAAVCSVEVVNGAPAFEPAVYRFELAENLDGRRRPVELGPVTAADPDGDSLTYEVTSGDRQRFAMQDGAGVVQYIGPGEDFETPPNRYELTVRARDPDGATAEAQVVVTVTDVNEPPTAGHDVAETREDEAVAVDVLANDTDPDGDVLRVESVSSAEHGTTRLAPGGDVEYMPAPDYHGPDRFTYVVSDPGGATATATVTVTVLTVNDPPEASDDSVTTEEDRSATFDVLANDTDPDGDVLRVESVSSSEHGTTRLAPGGGVEYTPAPDYHGPDRFTYVVSDPGGATATATVAVTVLTVNDPPEAGDDSVTTEEDRPATFDVLANDTDPDGDVLRVERVSSAEHGTTGVAPGGGVEYMPAPDYHGLDRFTYVVSDPDGATATAAVAVTVLSVNDAPVAVGVIPEQPLDEGGGSVDVDVTPYFDDPEGDALTLRAVSSDPDVAKVEVAGAVLTLTPVVYGSAMVTVTAEDAGGLTATQTFTVGVDDRLVRAVLGNTLAAMARSHLASVRMTLGRWVDAGGGDESRLTVMGRAVPLGKAAARQAAEQLVMGWLSSAAWSGSSAHVSGGSPFGTAGAAPGLHPASGFGRPAVGVGGPTRGGPGAVGMMPGATGGLYGLGGFGGGADAWLRGTEFELALGGDEAGGARAGRRWRVWGQGDIQTFYGSPTVFRYDARYDGDVRTGYVGVDARLTERWLAGVAVSRSGGGGDWQVGGSRGQLRTALTALHPYVQWSDGATSVWTTAGGGWGEGEAENVREATGLVGASGLGLRLGLVELRRELGTVGGGAEFGLRADAAWADLRTGEGRESVDSLSAAVNQQRLGAEVSRPLRLGALALRPFGEAHLRRDGGAGQTGTGVEVAFGLNLTGGIVRLDVQGRTLAVHSASGYGERGAGLTLTVGGQRREGLSLSVSPQWGDAASGTGVLWQEQVYRHSVSTEAETEDAFAVDARGDYGMRLPNGDLLTWFGTYRHSAYGRSFHVGGSIGGLADALLPGR